jgi:hypothetical protein
VGTYEWTLACESDGVIEIVSLVESEFLHETGNRNNFKTIINGRSLERERLRGQEYRKRAGRGAAH